MSDAMRIRQYEETLTENMELKAKLEAAEATIYDTGNSLEALRIRYRKLTDIALKAEDKVEAWQGSYDVAMQEKSALEQTIKDMKPYMTHTTSCMLVQPCKCGYDELQSLLNKESVCS